MRMLAPDIALSCSAGEAAGGLRGLLSREKDGPEWIFH